jgi:disulfide bond formation protein DsbB
MESQITSPVVPEDKFKRFSLPLKMGLLIALVKIIISTVSYQFFLGSWGMTMFLSFLSFAAGVVLLCVTGIQQRKARGGFINIREAFQSIFVAVLVLATLTFLYDIIYMTYIDPGMVDRIKESSIAFAEKMGAGQEKLDEMAESFETQSLDKMSIGKQFLSFLSTVVWYSIIGFICAAIIKKKKPEHLA